jgi:menaquinone-dependent protoporphyrinogen IX oxidase
MNMNGAIFFASKYGSTAQYANWIGEATGLPVFNVKKSKMDLLKYDFLVLGSPIIYYKLLNRKWMKANSAIIEKKPTILFTVSGAPAGAKLDRWIANSGLPEELITKMKHVALRGRQKPEELTWFDRMMLKIAAKRNPDPIAREEELNGFDYMDKSSIEPIIKLIQELQTNALVAS